MRESRRLARLAWILPVAALLIGLFSFGIGDLWALGRQATSKPVQSASTKPPEQAAVGQHAGSQDPQRPGPGGGRNGPEYKFWKDPATVRELGLTDKQVADLDGIYEDRRAKAQPFVDEFRKQQAELDRLMSDRTAGDSAIILQFGRMETAWDKVSETRMIMLYHMSLVLSPEQNKKLTAIHDRQRGRRGGEPHW